MILLAKILSGIILILLGLLVSYQSIKTTRRDGFSVGFIETISGIALIIIGSLILLGYIS